MTSLSIPLALCDALEAMDRPTFLADPENRAVFTNEAARASGKSLAQWIAATVGGGDMPYRVRRSPVRLWERTYWLTVMEDQPSKAAKGPSSTGTFAVARKAVGAEVFEAALEAALAAIPSPALVVDVDGVVLAANETGRAVCGEDGEGLRAALRDELDDKNGRSRFDVTALPAGGADRYYLVVITNRLADEGSRVQVAAKRWRLTPREKEVLAHGVLGQPSKTIAATLGCAVSTVEIHFTHIMAKARVAGRGELVARFWM